MQLKLIAVATDFSAQSEAAIRHGASLACSTGAGLHVVHVVETPADDEGLEASRPAVEHWHLNDVDRLKREVETCAGVDIDITQETVDALSTADGLQSVVEDRGADLVVVGSTGLTGIEQTVLGSTAGRVLRTVEAHVLVARDDAPANGYERILIPTDFSPSADKALELALALAAPNAQFELVHFWRVPEATRGDEYSELVIKTVGDSVEERGRRLLESFHRDAPTARFHSVQTSPERGITRKLDEGDYDLLVVGSYGRSKLRRWLLGSVAEYAARTASCTVAVARPD